MHPPSQAVQSSATHLLGHRLLRAGTPSRRPTHCAATASPNATVESTTIPAQWISSCACPVHTSLALTLEPHRNTSKDISRAFLLSHPGQRGRTRPVSAPMTQLPQHARQGLRAPGSLRHGLSLAACSAAHCRQDRGCLGTGGSGCKPPISSTPAPCQSTWHMALASQHLPRQQCGSWAWHRHCDSPSSCQGACQQTAREDHSSSSSLLCSGAMGEAGRYIGERLGTHMLEVYVDFFPQPFLTK